MMERVLYCRGYRKASKSTDLVADNISILDSSLNLAIAKTLDARADGIASRSTDPPYTMMDVCIKDQRRRHLFRLAGCILKKKTGHVPMYPHLPNAGISASSGHGMFEVFISPQFLQ
jgi:hypothetical protein